MKNLFIPLFVSLALFSTNAWSAKFNGGQLVEQVTQTTTAGGTTTLTATSNMFQRFVGSSNQSVILPNATTLNKGIKYIVSNAGTGVISVYENDGSTLLKTLPANTASQFYCVDTSTSNGTWDQAQFVGSGTGTVTSVAMTVPSVLSVSGSPVTTAGTFALSLGAGTWPIANGGTNAATAQVGFDNLSPLTTTGDVLGFSVGHNVRVAGNTSTSRKFMAETGDGTNAALQAWTLLSGSDLPNPSATTLGGIESYALVSHQWISSISTSGVPSSTQPAFTDLSGNISTGQMNSGTSASSSTFWRGDGTWATPAGAGTVTSVALSAPAEFSVSGSPVTTSGTLTLTKANQSANTVYSGPSSGAAAAPGFRTLVSADIPAAAAVVKSVTSQVFSTTGSHTYTPNANLLYAIVECVGGGGGGGGTPASGAGQGAAASGGGGGAYTQSLFTSATIGSSQTVTTGTGGSGGAAGQNNGGAGGSSSFGALVTAGGGSGGAASGLSSTGNYGPLASGGAGGTGSGTFRFSIPGQSGAWSWISNAVYTSGDGGNSGGGLGIGGRGLPEASSSTGLAGTGYGGGAGGSAAGASQAAQAGSAGAQGVVIVTEYNSQ